MAILPFRIGGGFTTESGPHAMMTQSPDGTFNIPWLTVAENAVYALDGWPKKMPGAAKVNTSATGASDSIMGIFDYWRQGTAGTAAQKRVIYAGTSIYKDDADGAWDSLLGSLEANKPASACVFNDELILSSTSNTDVPQVYDQSSIANLGGSPPNFAFAVEHKNRVFASGVASVPSRVYFTAFDNHEDWTGSGSGSFDVFTDDGDRVTGLYSLNDELVIFKGPYHGSIFRLIGSSPTGSDAYRLVPMGRGIGCVAHRSIIQTGGDLLFWDHNGIHSYSATAQFGNYAPALVSDSIASYFKDNLNHSRLEYVQGVDYSTKSLALWTVSSNGSSTNDKILGLDYRWRPARFFVWPVAAVASMGMVLDSTRGRIPWLGTYTGFVLRGDQTEKNWAGSAYTFRARTPFLEPTDQFDDFGATRGHVEFVPQGESTFTLSYIRDLHPADTVIVPQSAGGSAVLDAFTLDVDTLAGSSFATHFFDMHGSFKTIALELNQGGLNEDCEVHGISLEVLPQGPGHTETAG